MIRQLNGFINVFRKNRYIGLFLALILLVAYYSFKAEHFFSLATFSTIANQVPDLIIMSVGMTFVLIIAGIDLSVGSVMALSGSILGVMLIKYNVPIGISILLCILTGLACGLINGLVIVGWKPLFFIVILGVMLNKYNVPISISILLCILTGIACCFTKGQVFVGWKLPSFIVTLGMLEVARGLAYHVTESRTIYVDKLDFLIDPIFKWTNNGEVVNPCPWLTLPFILAIVIVCIAHFILNRTVLGRYMIAVGTNQEATELSGIDPNPIKISVFAISGLLAGLAAIIHTARYQANPNNGDGMELQVIAAVVIGGTSLMGGRGSVICTLFGVLIIKVLETGLSQIGAGEPTKRVITGVVIVIAVIFDYYKNKVSKKYAG